LFSHLVTLHEQATIPMPGEVGELFIGLNRRQQTGSIKGIVIPVGKSKKAGRLQGTKRKPRPEIHPVFGPLSRMFIFVDEIENVPFGLWSDIDNVCSMVTGNSADGIRIFGAYNPSNQYDEVGKRAEPKGGWGAFDIDKDYRWRSERGWEGLRLDGEKSENVILGEETYPGLQTRAGLEAIAKNAGGKETAAYYTMGRGAYPPQGAVLAIIPPGMLANMRGEFIWYSQPVAVGGADLALTGKAAAIYSLGKYGMASGMKLPPSLEFPNGRQVMFKDSTGTVRPRWALECTQQFALPKGDTTTMATNIIAFSKRAGVRPEFLAVDRTGHGAGVADLIKYQWGPQIHAVNYSEGASEGKLMAEDTKTCAEQFERMTSELWFALRALGEFQYFLINPDVDMTKLAPQLTERHFRVSGVKSRVETKKDYMDRGHDSPDEADSLTLLVHAARKGSGITLSMKGDASGNGSEDDDWPLPNNGVRIDVTNTTDTLSENDSWEHSF